MNARTRRWVQRYATLVLTCVLVVGGLAAVTLRFGEARWALTAPADRLGAVVADAEAERPGRRAPGSAHAAIPRPERADSAATARARRADGGAVADARPDPFARVGARTVVADPGSGDTPGDGPSNAMPGEPAFTMEVQRGQTVYRMNGDLVVDPEHQREEPVEGGYEYRFGKRGLEKVKLWEVRR